LVSLTLEGGKRLAESNSYWVEIEDFFPKGSIFACGIKEADDQIRIGDEAVVIHNGQVRGVGVALMNAEEMVESDRGEAIKLRHKLKI
jgi:archaeosine synthase